MASLEAGPRGAAGAARLRSDPALRKEDRALAHRMERPRAGRAVAGLALVCALGLGLGAPARAADDDVVDGIAAQVGSDIVLISEVRNLVGARGGEAPQGGRPRVRDRRAPGRRASSG